MVVDLCSGAGAPTMACIMASIHCKLNECEEGSVCTQKSMWLSLENFATEIPNDDPATNGSEVAEAVIEWSV